VVYDAAGLPVRANPAAVKLLGFDPVGPDPGRLPRALGAGQVSSIERLSDRELEVLDLIGRGLSSRQIAERLHLSIKTVESHREHIKSKLNLGSAAELAKYAFNWLNGRDKT
jgi:DNA-binding CsgD family transcriptional regulator